MSAELAEWLRAQITEDERVANEAAEGEWAPTERLGEPGERIEATGPTGETTMVIYDEGGHDEYDAAHIVAWQPSRVLAEVAAKRAILREFEMSGDPISRPLMEDILRIIAQPYRGRAGWRDEWRDE